jgi:hypothetical protein
MDDIIDMTATPVERVDQFSQWLLKKTQSGKMEWKELGAERHEFNRGNDGFELSYLTIEFRGVVPTRSQFIVRISAEIHESSLARAIQITMGKYTYGIGINKLRLKLYNAKGKFLPFLPPKEIRAFGGDDLVFSGRSHCQGPINLCAKVMERYGVHHPASKISHADSLFSEINAGGE